MTYRRILPVLFFLMIAVGLWAQSDDSNVRIVRISYTEGDVQFDNGNGLEKATMNMPVTEGNRVVTGDDGRVEIELEDGSTIRLAPGSDIQFSQLGRLSSGATVTTMGLNSGEAEFKIDKLGDNQIQVESQNKTLLVKHSGRFRVTSTNSDPLELVVWKGQVDVQDSDSGNDVSVKKNETFALDLLDPAKYDLSKDAEADDLDNWSKQRDDALSQYASKGSGYAQSPYSYGLNDLNYYGSYYDVPGYGYLWQPYGVNLDWDPFQNGYWAPSPFGYTWVSAYPWGWMPFRYGHWVFVNGRGWLWQPGGWNNWHVVPPVINPPRGFRPPVPPAIGGAGRMSAGTAGQPSTGRPLAPPGMNRTITPPAEPTRMNGGEAVRRRAVTGQQDHPATPQRGVVGDRTQSPANRAPSRTEEPSRPAPPPKMSPPPRTEAPRSVAPPPAPPRMSPPPAPPRMSPPPAPPSRSSSDNSGGRHH